MFVKDTGSKVGIYTSIPSNAKDLSLYREVTDVDEQNRIMDSLINAPEKHQYLISNLNDRGAAVMGHRSTYKKVVRAAIKGTPETAVNAIVTVPAVATPRKIDGRTKEGRALRAAAQAALNGEKVDKRTKAGKALENVVISEDASLDDVLNALVTG